MTRPREADEPSLAGPRIRERLDDFIVEERALYTPTGEGEHTFLWVEKRDLSTEDVARALARYAGVGNRDVGYAGRKDRRAVARQWFSVPGLAPERALSFLAEGARVLRAHRHPHKLRVGQLAGNRFALCVRGVDPAVIPDVERRFREAARIGFPNRFGRQRYGRDGDNPERARAALAGGRRPRDRRHLRFLVSALQAQVFDAALAERPFALDEVAVGEIAQVRASGGLFLVEDAETESARARRFEISATGPLFGTRPLAPEGAPGQRERALFERFGVDEWLEKARGMRLRGGRRAVRAALAEPSLAFEGGVVQLGFFLAAGSYATVLLETLFGAPVDDAPRGASVPSSRGWRTRPPASPATHSAEDPTG